MRRWYGPVLAFLALLLSGCGPAGASVPFYELIANPARYYGQEVTVLGFYYQKGAEEVLVVGVRTDDGFQNPVPLGDPICLQGMPAAVREQLNAAAGAVYGMVQVTGRFESSGSAGATCPYPSRLVVTDERQVIALEATRMQEERVPADLDVPGAVRLADLWAHPDSYAGQTVTVIAYYYGTPQTSLLAEGIRSLDGLHNAVPVGRQVWVEGWPGPAGLRSAENTSHGLVKVTGRFETRGGYGPQKAYAYRLVVESAEVVRR